MNDLHFAALLALAGAVAFIAAGFWRKHPERFRIAAAVGGALVAVTVALVLYDLGQIMEGLSKVGESFGEGLTVSTSTTTISWEACMDALADVDAALPADCAQHGLSP